MTRPGHRVAGPFLAMFLLQAGGALPTRADVRPLTLYEKTARAPLIVRARALSDATRRPRVEVVEVLKGIYRRPTLTLVPHFEDHSSPTPWLQREIFRKGEESLFFLKPYVDEFGRSEGPEAFSVLNADQGKLELPAEGSDALVGAIARFVAILALGRHDEQAEALRGLLRQRNPLLVEAGLAECRKFRLAQPDDAQVLVDLFDHPRPGFREGAVVLAGQLVADLKAGLIAQSKPERVFALLFDEVAATARYDEAESVRREAVHSLESFADGAALALLEGIGTADTSQAVRYAAQVAAYRLRDRLR